MRVARLLDPGESAPVHLALWIVQVLLALVFAAAGAAKLFTPLAELATKGMGGWVVDSPALLVRFIGASELLGAIGLVAPAATRVAPRLTPVAAAALAVVMVLAAGTHVAYGEHGSVVPNAVLGGLAAFVAWGRSKRRPIAARGA
jgi:putative oxidoreductase